MMWARRWAVLRDCDTLTTSHSLPERHKLKLINSYFINSHFRLNLLNFIKLNKINFYFDSILTNMFGDGCKGGQPRCSMTQPFLMSGTGHLYSRRWPANAPPTATTRWRSSDDDDDDDGEAEDDQRQPQGPGACGRARRPPRRSWPRPGTKRRRIQMDCARVEF